VLAELIPKLGLFISLVGAVSSSTLALIFPPLINILTTWHTGYGKYHWALWKDLSLMLFGTIGFLAGTYVSVENIINDVEK
jgi:proton-coupled amino acid transporter